MLIAQNVLSGKDTKCLVTELLNDWTKFRYNIHANTL